MSCFMYHLIKLGDGFIHEKMFIRKKGLEGKIRKQHLLSLYCIQCQGVSCTFSLANLAWEEGVGANEGCTGLNGNHL